MGYVAVKGGLSAIQAAEELVQRGRLEGQSPLLQVDQIIEQQRLVVDQIMSEAGLYSETLAALAFKQAEGDITEAVFLLRAYKSTLERVGYSLPVDTEKMKVWRRISSAFKNIPGGQLLGRTRDYTQRLLDYTLLTESRNEPTPTTATQTVEPPRKFGRVSNVLRNEGLMAPLPPQAEKEPFDITRESLKFPASRSARLQTLARGESGAMVAFAYSSMRGYGAVHPTISELRYGKAPVEMLHPLTGRPVRLGYVRLTEVEGIAHAGTPEAKSAENQEAKPSFDLGYGLIFGQNERKAIAMAILDKTLDLGSDAPTGDQEFVLYHIDSVESSGFVEHLKLPHYVTFQSSLDRAREERRLAFEQELRK
jgi:alpha-D-ribose 1-methylphosphonate 5-triphosphate synthase subunit PhnI